MAASSILHFQETQDTQILSVRVFGLELRGWLTMWTLNVRSLFAPSLLHALDGEGAELPADQFPNGGATALAVSPDVCDCVSFATAFSPLFSVL